MSLDDFYCYGIMAFFTLVPLLMIWFEWEFSNHARKSFPTWFSNFRDRHKQISLSQARKALSPLRNFYVRRQRANRLTAPMGGTSCYSHQLDAHYMIIHSNFIRSASERDLGSNRYISTVFIFDIEQRTPRIVITEHASNNAFYKRRKLTRHYYACPSTALHLIWLENPNDTRRDDDPKFCAKLKEMKFCNFYLEAYENICLISLSVENFAGTDKVKSQHFEEVRQRVIDLFEAFTESTLVHAGQ